MSGVDRSRPSGPSGGSDSSGAGARSAGRPDPGRGTWPQLSGEIRDGRHVLPVRVYYEDTDFTGIVYHANYLRFMERARTEYLRLIGADHRALFDAAERETPGFAFVVRAMKIEFLKPAHMDDLLEVVTEPNDVKGASVLVRQRVMRAAETLVEADVRVAFISGGRACPIPKPLRIALAADQERALGSAPRQP
jgi:acyl-CoA thioester hydrolase